MKQFIIESEPDKDGLIRLDGKDYHYLVHVRRLAAGEYFPALLPGNKETLVQVVSVSNGALTGKCTAYTAKAACQNDIEKNSSDDIPPIILFQALPKNDKMDLIVRQAAEGGITEIVPFVSEFSTGKADVGREKLSRWQRIIKEARQQSGSRISTSLRPPVPLDQLIDYWNKIKGNDALGLLFHHLPETPGSQPDEKSHFKGLENKCLHGYLCNKRKIVVLVIGPESGFSGAEVSLFLENGFNAVTVGNTVLRTETAALYCAAAVRILLLEKDSWELRKK